MKKNTFKKLNNKGFSLGELLLTILIICLAGVAMTGGFTTIHHTYKQLTQKANAETLLSTTINKTNHYIRYGEDVTVTPLTIDFIDVNQGYQMAVTNPEPHETFKGLVLRYYFGNNKQESYQLLADDAMTNGLLPKLSDVTADPLTHTVTFTISIYHDSNPAKAIASQQITTRLLNE